MSLNLGVLSAAVTLSDAQYVNTLDNLEKKSESVFKKIGDAVTNYLTTNTIVAFAQDSVAAFRTQESAVESVRATLRNLGKETDLATARMGEFASEMQKITVYGDEGTLAAMAQGMRLGIDPAEIENVTKAAMGLAAKIGTDLPTAMMLLARASKGQTQMLSRYGIALDETKSKEEQYQDILKAGVDSFPLVTAAADTATGKMTQFANALGDTKEVFGEQWQKALTDVVTPLTGLLTEFNNADQATKKLVVSAASLTAGLVLLNNLGFLKAANSAVMAAAGFLKSATAAGIASGGVKALTASISALNVALGPVGWAAIALTAAYAGLTYIEAEHQKNIENLIDKSNKELDITNKEISALKEKNRQEDEAIARLNDLSKYERLTNEEIIEANKLIDKLKDSYGDLAVEIDNTTGKLDIAAGAFDKITEAQRQAEIQMSEKKLEKIYAKTIAHTGAAIKEFMPTWRSFFLAGDTDIAGSLMGIVDSQFMTTKEKIKALEEFSNKSTLKYGSRSDETKSIESVIGLLKEQRKQEEKIRRLKEGKPDTDEEEEKKRKKKTEEQRKALLELSETEWTIAFDVAIPMDKIQMLRDKIDGIFEQYKRTGKYASVGDFLSADKTNLTEKELKDRQEIIKLLAQEDKLTAQVADEMERKRDAQGQELLDARRRKEEIVEQNRDFIAEQAAQQIEIQLKNLQVSGDTAGYNALVQQELAKATQAAAKAQQEYMSAFAKIKNEQTVDKDTEEQLRKLLRTAQDAQQKQRAWEGKLNTDENADVQQEQTRKVVGAWSLAEFSRQQENSVESRIEKNTRETARLLKNSKGLVY